MEFPDELLRGIPNATFIEKDGSPASHLFNFDKKPNTPDRQDGFVEESINWHDEPKALDIIVHQTKEDGNYQFHYGVVVLSRTELDRLISKPTVGEDLSYERYPIDGNDYHGNLLLNHSVEKSKKRRVAASIATICVNTVIKFDR